MQLYELFMCEILHFVSLYAKSKKQNRLNDRSKNGNTAAAATTVIRKYTDCVHHVRTQNDELTLDEL